MVGSHRGGNIVIFDAHVLISPAGLGDEHSIERIAMKSDEGSKSVSFYAVGDRWLSCRRVRGGGTAWVLA